MASDANNFSKCWFITRYAHKYKAVDIQNSMYSTTWKFEAFCKGDHFSRKIQKNLTFLFFKCKWLVMIFIGHYCSFLRYHFICLNYSLLQRILRDRFNLPLFNFFRKKNWIAKCSNGIHIKFIWHSAKMLECIPLAIIAKLIIRVPRICAAIIKKSLFQWV